jgi:hypothetical protein
MNLSKGLGTKLVAAWLNAPLLLLLAACGSGASTGAGPSDSGATGDITVPPDGSTPEAGPTDSASTDATRSDGAPTDTGAGEASTDAGSVYTDFTDPANWETANTGNAGTMGAAFDGRYVYYGPHNNMIAWRYDTHGAWDGGAWDAYFLPGSPPASGTVFGDNNGKFVYFVPYASSAARFDTSGAFRDAGAWTSDDVSSTVPGAGQAWGGTFDGRYFYIGVYAGSPSKVWAMRYDSNAATFGAWEAFDTSLLAVAGDAGVPGLYPSPGTDGKYVYYSGAWLSATSGSAIVARFPVGGTFTDPASWETYDVGALKGSVPTCAGTVFDGRYLYFVPDNYSLAADTVVRYDTTASFTSASAWSFFDILNVATNPQRYSGGTFDGRYVYFAPFDPGVVVRVDTTAPFTANTSWGVFDTAPMGGASYAGAAFDGQYVYFAPYTTALTASYVRFKARATPSTPPKIASGSL